MGTEWQVSCFVPPGCDRLTVQEGIQGRLDRVDRQMSTWDAASDLCRYNQAAPGTRVPIPTPLFRVLAIALEVAEASTGACDPTAGELVDLWGFGPGAPFRQADFAPPDRARIDEALMRCGWRRLVLDAGDGCALQPGGVRLDLSGIAKGFGVDDVSRFLNDIGVASHLVDVGGELRGAGVKPDGQPWWIGLEMPVPVSGTAAPVVALCGLSVATSGDYRRWFERDGRRYAHTIDPRTGQPVSNRVASVTVLHADCVRADAFATALTVLGVESGLAWADRHELAVRFLVRADRGLIERTSTAWAAMLQ
jgi:FAD:protein FMN transferase